MDTDPHNLTLSGLAAIIQDAIAKHGDIIIAAGIEDPAPSRFCAYAVSFRPAGSMHLSEILATIAGIMGQEFTFCNGHTAEVCPLHTVMIGPTFWRPEMAAHAMAHRATAQVQIDAMKAQAELKELRGRIRFFYAAGMGDATDESAMDIMTAEQMLDAITRHAAAAVDLVSPIGDLDGRLRRLAMLAKAIGFPEAEIVGRVGYGQNMTLGEISNERVNYPALFAAPVRMGLDLGVDAWPHLNDKIQHEGEHPADWITVYPTHEAADAACDTHRDSAIAERDRRREAEDAAALEREAASHADAMAVPSASEGEAAAIAHGFNPPEN